MSSKQIWELASATVNTNTDVVPRTQFSSGDAEKLTLADVFFVGAVQPNETAKTDMTIQAANNTAGTGSDLILQPGQGTSNNDGTVSIRKTSATATGQNVLEIKRGSNVIARIDDSSCLVVGAGNTVPEPTVSNGSAIFGQNNVPQQQIVSTVVSGANNTIGAEYSVIAGSNNTNESTAYLTSSIIVGYNNYTADLTNVHVFILGDGNRVSSGPGIEDTYMVGSSNRGAGCGWAVGTSNFVAGNAYPCSYAIGYNNKSYDGGIAIGTNNLTYGETGNSGSSSFAIGVDNEAIGSNSYAIGLNNQVGTYWSVSLISGNTFQYDTPGDFTSSFTGVGTKVCLSYLNIYQTRTAEWLTFSNVTFTGGFTRFDLAARSMTPNATPAYQIGFSDASESFVIGYGNQIYKSSIVSVLGRSLVLNGCSNTHLFGYSMSKTGESNKIFVGGDATVVLESTSFINTEGMPVNTPSTYTTSLTVNGSGNLALNNSTLNRSIITINQTTDIDINSITYMGPVAAVRNGQQLRIVNIGVNTITFHKDNASGVSGYRIKWAKAGLPLILAENESVSLIYLNNLPLSGSTGGWLLLPDGHP